MIALLVLGLANLAIGITNSIQANAEYAWINLLCATLLIVGMLRAPSRRGSLCSRGTASTLMCPAWRCSARATCSDCELSDGE